MGPSMCMMSSELRLKGVVRLIALGLPMSSSPDTPPASVVGAGSIWERLLWPGMPLRERLPRTRLRLLRCKCMQACMRMGRERRARKTGPRAAKCMVAMQGMCVCARGRACRAQGEWGASKLSVFCMAMACNSGTPPPLPPVCTCCLPLGLQRCCIGSFCTP